MIYLENIRDFALRDFNFFLIIIEITAASLLSFIAILSFSKSKNMSSFFLILTTFFLFIRMVARVLALLNIIYIDEIKINGFSIYSHIIEILPYITLSIVLIINLLKKE